MTKGKGYAPVFTVGHVEPRTKAPWPDRVEKWARDRNIVQEGTLNSQLSKLTEELMELAGGIKDRNPTEIKDGIGDCSVVLRIIAAIADEQFEEDLSYYACLEHAWEEIKDRKGRLVDGKFVKEQ